MKLQLWARVAFWLATLAVLLLTLLPAEHLPSKGPFDFWDKAQHALAFAMLTMLALLGWPQAELRWPILLSLLTLGGVIEVSQHVSGWRHGELADWGADVFGVVLATLGASVRPPPS
jgi:VanZ family protein